MKIKKKVWKELEKAVAELSNKSLVAQDAAIELEKQVDYIATFVSNFITKEKNP